MPEILTWSWFLQELVGHWLIVLLSIVATAMIGIARRYWPKVADIAGYALIGLVIGLIFVLFLAALNYQLDHQKKVSDRIAEVTDRQTEVLEKLAKERPAKSYERPTRPYFTHKHSEIQKPEAGRRTLSLALRNHGAPANNIVTQLLLLDNSLDPTKKPLYSNRVDSANPIGPQGLLAKHLDLNLKPSMGPVFVVFQFRYTNALSNEQYSQVLYLTFLGVTQDGKYNPNLVHATADDRARMERYIKERGIPTL